MAGQLDEIADMLASMGEQTLTGPVARDKERQFTIRELSEVCCLVLSRALLSRHQVLKPAVCCQCE